MIKTNKNSDKKLKEEIKNQQGFQKRQKRIHMFSEMPIWKSLIKMSIPSIITMLVIGGYFFSDSILSAQFAGDSYKKFGQLTGSDQVRMFMNAFSPINSIIIAFSLLFAIGLSTRVSINLGAKNHDRAIKTMKTGMMISMIISLILIPILFFSAKPWMSGQYDGDFSTIAADKGFDYGWIIIISIPMSFFNQNISSLLRTEARNKQMLIGMVIPIFFNLLFDWIFMGPVGMGVEGAAWATLINTVLTTLIYVFFITKDRHHSMITFKNMFGKFTLLPLLGIILVGISPFFRNMAQSITGTVEMHVMSDVFRGKTILPSGEIIFDVDIKKAQLAGVFPIFGLFFPLLFGLTQSAGPIASFNYGAKNYKRVKQTYWWSTLYAFILGVITYFLSSFLLGEPLLEALGTNKILIEDSLRILKIVMIAVLLFSFAISGMVILSSTDRLIASLISSTLRGIILFFPTIYLFRYLGIHFSSYEDMFWWFFPTVSALTSIVIFTMSIYTMKHLNHRNKTLDERIEKLYAWGIRIKKNIKR